MKRLNFLTVALTLAISSYPFDSALSRPRSDAARQRDAASINPTLAYVMIDTPTPLTLMLLRIPTEAERAAQLAERSALLAEGQRGHAAEVEAWQSAQARYSECVASGQSNCGEAPERPADTAEKTLPFLFGETVRIDRRSRIARSGERSTYLTELPPGQYVIYTWEGSGGSLPTCLCFGNLAFQVLPGQVTDLGLLDGFAATNGSEIGLISSVTITPRQTGPIDVRLTGARIVPAAFSPVGKLPQLGPSFVDRVAAVPGLITYDRDRVIDARTGADITLDLLASGSRPDAVELQAPR